MAAEAALLPGRAGGVDQPGGRGGGGVSGKGARGAEGGGGYGCLSNQSAYGSTVLLGWKKFKCIIQFLHIL